MTSSTGDKETDGRRGQGSKTVLDFSQESQLKRYTLIRKKESMKDRLRERERKKEQIKRRNSPCHGWRSNTVQIKHTHTHTHTPRKMPIFSIPLPSVVSYNV